jgi:Uma2 family endonuclease
MLGAKAKIEEKLYTVEEYFELEKHSDIRHEFYYGKLIPMPGESVKANLIAGNIDFQVKLSLKSKGYVVIRHDVRTIVRERKIYRYPDIAIIKLGDISDTHAIRLPEMLVEVTSKNSTSTDHNEKLKEYTALGSVKYYMIVSQDEKLVEVYTRNNGRSWHYDIYTEDDIEIHLSLLDLTLKMSDIYESVVFAETKSDE